MNRMTLFADDNHQRFVRMRAEVSVDLLMGCEHGDDGLQRDVFLSRSESTGSRQLEIENPCIFQEERERERDRLVRLHEQRSN